MSAKRIVSRTYNELSKLSSQEREKKIKFQKGKRTYVNITVKAILPWQVSSGKIITPIAIQELQVKTPVSYFYTLFTLVKRKNSNSRKCRMWEN